MQNLEVTRASLKLQHWEIFFACSSPPLPTLCVWGFQVYKNHHVDLFGHGSFVTRVELYLGVARCHCQWLLGLHCGMRQEMLFAFKNLFGCLLNVQ